MFILCGAFFSLHHNLKLVAPRFLKFYSFIMLFKSPFMHIHIFEIGMHLSWTKKASERCFQKFHKFTGKYLCQSLFFNKVVGLRSATLLKKRLWHRCFPVNFAKFLRPFYLEHLWWLLLKMGSRTIVPQEIRPAILFKKEALNKF